MIGAIVRFVVSAVVLLLLGFIMPGLFSVAGFWTALWAAIVIAALGWLVSALLGRRASPAARGFTGFLVAAAVIWIAQLFVPGMRVTILGALLAALIIGLIDAFVPTELR